MDHSITIRDFEASDRDYEAIVAISKVVFPEYPGSAAEARYRDENLDRTKYAQRRIIAENSASGEVVAFGEYAHRMHSFDPDRYGIWIEVLPPYQRQGIGSAIYDRLLAELAGRGARELGTQARENMPESIAFLQKRGFVETHREWESRIDPRQFDPAPFEHYLDQVAGSGIKITTLAELRESDPDWLQKLYDLHVSAEADVPSPHEYTPPDVEQVRKLFLEGPTVPPDGFFIAVDGDRYVGESYLETTEDDPSLLYQGLTGVRREDRGKGIAMALKLFTLRYARERGYRVLQTWNSTLNAPMLGINVRLGFVRQPAWIEMERKMGQES